MSATGADFDSAMIGDSVALLDNTRGESPANMDLAAEGRGGEAAKTATNGTAREQRRLWITMLLCGAGFLFPFNTYIAAADFLNQRYGEYKPEFYITLVYMYSTMCSVCTNIFYAINRFGIRTRIRFGYYMFYFALITFILVEAAESSGNISRRNGFGGMLATVALCALGSGVQQSSFYGFCGLFGETYTLALMVGESAAGIAVSFNRIVTKASYDDGSEAATKRSTFVFLYMSLGYIAFCQILSEFMYRSEITKQTLATSPYAEDAPEVFQLASISGSSTTDGAMDEARDAGNANIAAAAGAADLQPRSAGARRRVYSLVRTPMGAVFLSFLVTLSTFPGVTTIPTDPTLADWAPIIVIATFNVGDMMGKLLPFCGVDRLKASSWSPHSLLKFTAKRSPLIILILLCAAPRKQPLFQSIGWIIVFTFVLAITGGYSATVAMAMGPVQCRPADRELAGVMMTVALLCGLTTGATLSIALLAIIDPGSFES